MSTPWEYICAIILSGPRITPAWDSLTHLIPKWEKCFLSLLWWSSHKGNLVQLFNLCIWRGHGRLKRTSMTLWFNRCSSSHSTCCLRETTFLVWSIIAQSTLLTPAQWLSGRASALWPRGCGFDPQLGYTKDFKNGTMVLSIKKVELELAKLIVRIMWLGGISCQSVCCMIFQWGSTLKVSIELPATSRLRRNMTERGWKQC